MSRIYSASKIGINFSLNNDINMRMFEILSCGAMLLTSQIEDNGFSELFKEGKHLITYKDKEDLKEKIIYYLEHEEEREAIAQAGCKLAVEEHTYKNRLEKMFSIIKNDMPDKFEGLKI
jgi:spore maturation protein CgeB